MNEEKYIWENEQFRKDPFRVPENYFASFPDKMMELLSQEVAGKPEAHVRYFRPWMAWVSGIAATLIIGWIGVRQFYVKPQTEKNLQETIDLFVDLYGDELNEGQLAGYLSENKISLKMNQVTEMSTLIQSDPDLAEMYLYESVGK